MEIKDIIKKRREELNLTYEQLGNMIGVGKSTVRKWETGMIENMRRDNIVALSKALNISPAVIMGWNDIDANEPSINLSKEEITLLENFNKLNDLGKSEANKRVAELTEINRYLKTTSDEISATKIKLIKDEPQYIENIKVLPKQKEITYDDFETVAAHNDDLTNDEIAEADRRILEDINKRNKK